MKKSSVIGMKAKERNERPPGRKQNYVPRTVTRDCSRFEGRIAPDWNLSFAVKFDCPSSFSSQTSHGEKEHDRLTTRIEELSMQVCAMICSTHYLNNTHTHWVAFIRRDRKVPRWSEWFLSTCRDMVLRSQLGETIQYWDLLTRNVVH